MAKGTGPAADNRPSGSRPPRRGTSPAAESRRARRRSAGEGSVYPDADGRRWRGAVTWTDPDGRRHRRVVSAPTSAAARDKVDRLRAELRLGEVAPAGPALTVGEYLDSWIERDRIRVRPATWVGRSSHVSTYLVPTLGRLALARLMPSDVERALATWLDKGRPVTAGERRRGAPPPRPIAPLTARHIRATLRIALADAVREGLVPRNAAADARAPYVPHREITFLEAPDLVRLLEATADDELGPLYAMAATTGLRLGELLGLSWRDVRGGTLTVRRSLALATRGSWKLAEPKSARSRRTIPLPARAREALATQEARQAANRAAAGAAWQDGDGLVFTDAVGRPWRPDRVSSAFGRACAAAGGPRIRLHDLRHTAATLLLAEGTPLAVISDLLGHSGIAITAGYYAGVVPELRQDAADAMDRALAKRK